jgi:hypothetical protein
MVGTYTITSVQRLNKFEEILPLVTLIPERSNKFRGWFELIFATTKMIHE